MLYEIPLEDDGRWHPFDFYLEYLDPDSFAILAVVNGGLAYRRVIKRGEITELDFKKTYSTLLDGLCIIEIFPDGMSFTSNIVGCTYSLFFKAQHALRAEQAY